MTRSRLLSAASPLSLHFASTTAWASSSWHISKMAERAAALSVGREARPKAKPKPSAPHDTAATQGTPMSVVISSNQLRRPVTFGATEAKRSARRRPQAATGSTRRRCHPATRGLRRPARSIQASRAGPPPPRRCRPQSRYSTETAARTRAGPAAGAGTDPPAASRGPTIGEPPGRKP